MDVDGKTYWCPAGRHPYTFRVTTTQLAAYWCGSDAR
jgi:hypothetical protein